MSGSQQSGSDRLDRALAALPRELTPSRDLWPGIDAGLPAAGLRRRRSPWLWQAAAAAVLMAGSSLLTAAWLQRDRPEVATATATVPPAAAPVSASSFGAAYALDPDSLEVRRRLVASLAAEMQRLPPSARLKVEQNLAEMRRAADEINAALRERPGDPLLEELLVGAYQAELAVLSSLNQATRRDPRLADPNETRRPL